MKRNVFTPVFTRSFLTLSAVVSCVLAFSAFAEERQHKVEAAFVYNFFNYITWPNYDDSQDLKDPIICVYGNDPIVESLKYIQQKMAPTRVITIQVVHKSLQARDCNLLFIRHRLPFDLSALNDTTLTVFKPDDPLDRGGMIDLTEDEEHITIHIDQFEMERKGFKTSSRLLNLARAR